MGLLVRGHVRRQWRRAYPPFDSFGRSVTVTVVVQANGSPAALVAEHETVVVPIRNCEPDFGEQLTVTGRVPSLNTGSAKSTAAFPLCPVSLTGGIVGHARVTETGAGPRVGVGSVVGSVGAGSVVGSVGVGSVVGSVGAGSDAG